MIDAFGIYPSKIRVIPFATPSLQSLALGDGRNQDGGTTQQWRIDETMHTLAGPPRM